MLALEEMALSRVVAGTVCRLQPAAGADAGESVRDGAHVWCGGGQCVGMPADVSQSPWLLLAVLLRFFPDQASG